jgi:uncharacterized protein (TIGR03086 family)
MTTSTEELAAIAERYKELSVRLAECIAAVPPGAWTNRSPCAEWNAAGVLQHVIDSEADMVRRVGLELPPIPPAAEDPDGAWAAAAGAVGHILSDPALAGTEYEGVFGRSTLARTFDTFFRFDLIVHRWDIATAAGISADLSDDELTTVDTFAGQMGDNLYGQGVCTGPLEVPESASRREKILARIGRQDPTGS